MSDTTPVVHGGAPCRHLGSHAVSTAGNDMVCALPPGGAQARWMLRNPSPKGSRRRAATSAAHTGAGVMAPTLPFLPLIVIPAPPPAPAAPTVAEPAAPTVPGGELTELEHRILAFEQQPWPNIGTKERHIKDDLDITPTMRYYQLLNNLIDRPAARAAYPVLIGILGRRRNRRRFR